MAVLLLTLGSGIPRDMGGIEFDIEGNKVRYCDTYNHDRILNKVSGVIKRKGMIM